MNVIFVHRTFFRILNIYYLTVDIENMIAGVWNGSPVPVRGREWLAHTGRKGMGSVWIMGPQDSEWGSADR